MPSLNLWTLQIKNVVANMQIKNLLASGSDSKESAYNAGDMGWIPGSERDPGGGNGYPLQYSCPENSMDRRAWRAVVQVVTKSQTELRDFCFHFFFKSMNIKGKKMFLMCK